jgi:hypothetical protein
MAATQDLAIGPDLIFYTGELPKYLDFYGIYHVV